MISSGCLLNLQKPALSTNFKLSPVPNTDPSNVKSLLIRITNLSIKPKYIETTEQFNIAFKTNIDGYESKTQEVQTNLDQQKNLTDLQDANPNFGTVTIEGINESQSTISGEVILRIQGENISKDYKRNFTISDENIAETLTTNATLNNQSIRITVLEDVNSTGSYDNTENILIGDGTNSYNLTNIQGGSGNIYKITADLETTNINRTPVLKSVGLKNLISLNNSQSWDNIASSSGIVHENTSNTDQTDSTTVKIGYSLQEPLFDNNLIGYWPLQEDQGSTSYDFSSNSNNGYHKRTNNRF